MKDICSALFSVPSTAGSAPHGGDLLVAEPFMDENYFSHSVVSVIDYEPNGGAMGVVLNHQSPSMLSDVLDDVEIKVDMPVFCGGPLALDHLFFLHTLGNDIIQGARAYAPGIYIGGDFDTMIEYVNSGYPTEGKVRFFVGYSGWDEGQLEQELAEGSWAMLRYSDRIKEILRGHGDAYWHRTVRQLGEQYRPWRLVPHLTCAN
ncbi:MAG: YqgE/AlgH family protein [Muribaculaceae bacterium]|nr:YqgE/AlgH family protein [Muribaculaceae bacterium]